MASKKRLSTVKVDSAPTPKIVKTDDATDFLQEIEKKRLACCSSIADFKFNKKRVKVISGPEEIPDSASAVLYWMSRDQRVQDNWSLLYAQRLALKTELPLIVCFCLVPSFLNATIRHFKFLLKGLEEVAKECEELSIPFVLLLGQAKTVLPPFVKEHKIGAVIADFSPLRVPRGWKKDVADVLSEDIPFCQVDSHNIVPCWIASDKLEYGARTIRRKVMDKLPEFCTEFPPVVKHPHSISSKTKLPKVDWDAAYSSLEVDRIVDEVEWAKPGMRAGLQVLHQFCHSRLKKFADHRNDPTQEVLSNLSPWFHFGQISVQRCILIVQTFKKSCSKAVDVFVEEAVVRRELAENFCYYNDNYDSIAGAWEWARKTLNDHKKDKREYLYTRDQLQDSKTHDLLWNAAQKQMVVEGKMHGFLRMYWAKKILEWTKSPEEALDIAIYLNDKYELDGRDPNGYVGCMWSICGVHDQGWAERPVFGKIRYMNYNGCKRKFDVDAFIAKYRKYK